jgi:DNA-binding NarL/FixJ family response regulator
MIKIILADTQAIFRTGAAKVLAVEDELRIVAQAQSSEQLLIAVDRFRGAVVLIASNFHNDLKAVLETAGAVKSRVVIIAEHNEASQAFMEMGAAGVVFRSITGPQLVQCVQKVARGETFLQQAPGTNIPNENDLVGARVRDRLTPKELRIVALIVQGYKNKEIANQLGTTEQVIKNYLRNVYDKIGVSDRLELALFTIHHRILAEAASAAVAGMAAATTAAAAAQ